MASSAPEGCMEDILLALSWSESNSALPEDTENLYEMQDAFKKYNDFV